MFSYIEQDSFLHRLNPMVKLFVILAITILISVSFYPVLPITTFVLSFLVICIGGKFSFWQILNRIRFFLAVAASFIFFMFLLKGLDNPGASYHIFIFQWNPEDIVYILSLGTRILAIVTMSMGFVLTTSPNDLVLSLILQMKLPYVHGYAALAAYRFLPTLQDEIKNIKLAQEIRGIEWESGIWNRVRAPFRIMLPLLCNAARRGEWVAIAMESRGLGASKKRTFYKRTKIKKEDIIFCVTAVAFYGILTAALAATGMFHYNIGFSNH